MSKVKAKAKAKGKAKVKPAAKKAVGIAVREGGIGNVIVAGIKKGSDTETILKAVKKAFPKAKTTAACVSWYRSKLNQQ